MDYQESLDYIKSLTPTLERPSLSRLENYFAALGSPQQSLAAFHVGGTNGKGSVTALITSMLSALGFRTGKFTGPHLLSFRERFVVDRDGQSQPISEVDFARVASIVYEQSAHFAGADAELRLTWFEFLTAMAVQYFIDQKVDRAVFEVGLGGRFDATNILTRVLVSTICNVELDHMHLLGDTREKIAFEKAGIIRAGVPVVTACDGAPLQVIVERARSLGSPVIALKFAVEDAYRQFEATAIGGDSSFGEKLAACVRWIKTDFFKGDEKELSQLCGLAGAYQRGNVLLALLAVLVGTGELERRRWQGEEDLQARLLQGLKSAYWPGRYQFLEAQKVILDGAHNPHGAMALRSSLELQFGGPFVFLFSSFENKNAEQVLKNLLGADSQDVVVCFASPSERAMHKPETLQEIAAGLGARALSAPSFSEALKLGRQAQADFSLRTKCPYLIATGSFATVREAWKHFQLDSNMVRIYPGQ